MLNMSDNKMGREAPLSELLIRQWHPTKNGLLCPKELSAGSQRKVWWKCDEGHEWIAGINSRAKFDTGCPFCAQRRAIAGESDLATQNPALAAQWSDERNGRLTPGCVTVSSRKTVWWVCDKGPEYQEKICNAVAGVGCPYCANRKLLVGFNDLETVEPELAAQWHPTKNETLQPSMVLVRSGRRIWWQCENGHAWRGGINIRVDKKSTGCPVCAKARGGNIR